ncbi:hypothetical protein Dcar01_02147 [Deinococcus carri]|uniref:N-acetyltransferase domain-containing protein n=2 Tax=Deinococcus carri TaxID=1211323 RepID=A0ABP9WB42_9DEIO
MIRDAREEDLPALLALYHQLSARDPATVSERHRAAWAALARQDITRILVAENGGEVVGTLALSIIPNLTRDARPYALIENVVTCEERRGQGIGRRLLEEAERLARDREAYKLMLMSGNVRGEAHAFYRRCGFNGETKTAFEKRLA